MGWTMKKFGRVLLVSLLVSAMTATPVFAEPSVKDLNEDKKAAQSEADTLQRELQTLIGKMDKLEMDLIEKGEAITQAETDLATAEEKEQQQYNAMKLRIKKVYEEGDSSFLETLFSAEDFTDLLNKAEYVQNVHDYDQKLFKAYNETKLEIAELKSTLETEMEALEELQDEYIEEKSGLDKTLEEKREEIKDLDEQIQKAAEAERRRKEEEERRRQEEERRKQEESHNQNQNQNNNRPVNPPVGNDGGSYNGGGGSLGSGSPIVSGAQAYLGVPYVWGGTSGSGVDCSGLVYLAHRAAGLNVPRSSWGLGGSGKPVSNPQPGDVVCYSGHVGIYVGGGRMIHAPEPGKVVCYTNVDYAPHWFRRYW